MSIRFDVARWSRVKEVVREWWAGRLKRPLIQIRLQGRDPQRPAPRHPCLGFTARYLTSVTPEEIVDVSELDAVARQLGSAEGIVVFDTLPLSRKAEAEALLRRYSVI